MYARSTSAHVVPASLDALIAFVRDQALPQLQKARGFKHFLDLVERQTGNAIAISFWETEADMRAAEELGNKVRAAAVSAVHADPPKVDRYEVLIEEHSSSPAAAGHAAARVITTQANPAGTDQAVQYLREHIVPHVIARKGFRSYYVMGDRQTGSSLAVVIYDSEADRKAAEPAANAANAQMIRDRNTGPLNVTNYEVAFSV